MSVSGRINLWNKIKNEEKKNEISSWKAGVSTFEVCSAYPSPFFCFSIFSVIAYK